MLVMLMVGAAACEPLVAEQAAPQVDPSPAKVEPQRFDFPGVTIDLERRFVDLEAVVCLDRGDLELIACTQGTKEHESIVSVKASPKHIHLGLLLLGAKNGKPAMRRRIGKDDGAWVDVPPSGDPIAVFLVLKNPTGQMVEHPIRTFVTPAIHNDQDAAEEDGEDRRAPAAAEGLDTFLFAGSQMVRGKNGKGHYLADSRGNVISLSTFGDEVLCLPGIRSKDNAALMWQVDPGKLPKVGSQVILRLRPKAEEKPES